MTVQSTLARLTGHERLNFLLTNRIPRRAVTHLMGWFSRIRSPRLTRLSVAVWRLFASDLDLSEARRTTFGSIHECFIRELKPGARPIDTDPSVVISPCDAIVGAGGAIDGCEVFQAKGFPYELGELVSEESFEADFRDGTFVTLRLKSSMYHRFHAPVDCRVDEVVYFSGDTWNVNPIALRRVEKLFCKNERAYLRLHQDDPSLGLALVPVAAVLVASMRFHCISQGLNLRYRGPNKMACAATYARGDEMGYFEHGSTILVFANRRYTLAPGIEEGSAIRMGQPLLCVNPVGGLDSATA